MNLVISAVSHAKSISRTVFDAYNRDSRCSSIKEYASPFSFFSLLLVYNIARERRIRARIVVYARHVLRATVVAVYDASRYYVVHVIAPRISRVAYGTNNKE